MRISSLLVFGALTLALTFVTLRANAQMSEGERKAAARAAYSEGVDLQDKGKPADALTKFEQAQKLFDAPTHLLHIGECLALTGKLVEASETYETLARKSLPPGSPDAFVQAQQRGQAELTELRQRIPTLRVTVKPDPSTLQNLQINLNDKQLPNEVIGIARPVNPGTYRLTARANGWATANVVTVDLPEKEQKNVDLVLTQGATPIVVGPPVVGGATGNSNAANPPPPPYETKPKPPPSGPSTTGLLLGARGGVFVPNGDVQKNEPFQNYASAGGGGGVDVIGRVAKLFLIGGTLELATLGGPNAESIAQGASAKIKTSTIYYGILAGIMPNVDKVTFIADIGLGYRTLSQTRNLNITLPVSRSVNTEESYSGVELSLNAGLSIPAGPIRIVPKAGFAFGSFSSRECKVGVQDLAGGCAGGIRNPPVQTSGHTIFNVQLALYYHIDLAKKPAPPTAATTQ